MACSCNLATSRPGAADVSGRGLRIGFVVDFESISIVRIGCFRQPSGLRGTLCRCVAVRFRFSSAKYEETDLYLTNHGGKKCGTRHFSFRDLGRIPQK